MFGNDCDFDLAVLNIKNGIPAVSLQGDLLIFAVLGNRSSFANLGEEIDRIEWWFFQWLALSLSRRKRIDARIVQRHEPRFHSQKQ